MAVMAYPHVIIAGAGLGGLCLAQGLRGRGIEVTVVERDASLASRRQGYRIHIDGHGDAALAATLPAHLHALFRATAGTPGSTTMTVFDHELRPVHTVPSSGEGVHLAVNRLTLRQILLAGLADAVHFDAALARFGTGPDGRVTAHLADGTHVTGDILVAADGVNSAVRRQLLPAARIVDTGLRQLYGRVPLTAETARLFTDDMDAIFTPVIGPRGEYVGLGAVRYPEPVRAANARLAPALRLTDHEDYATVSFGARPELLPCTDAELTAMTGDELRAMTLDLIAGWHPRVRAMIGHWTADSVFPLTLRTSVPIGPWPTTPVTLLGDAIHAMSPAGGVGANTALRDAAALTDTLAAVADGADLIPALAGYEAAMRDYGFAAVRWSAANGHRLLGQDPLPAA